jgi:hypothetical protein
MIISREGGRKVFKPFTMLITFESEFELDELIEFTNSNKLHVPFINSSNIAGINMFLRKQK